MRARSFHTCNLHSSLDNVTYILTALHASLLASSDIPSGAYECYLAVTLFPITSSLRSVIFNTANVETFLQHFFSRYLNV